MKTILPVLSALIFCSLTAQEPKWEHGFGFNSGTSGSGVHYYGNRNFNESLGWIFEARFFDLKGDNEIVANSNTVYYDPTTVGGISLVMMNLETGLRYFPFAGQIANNFAPYVFLTAGPNLIFDAPEQGDFFDRWSKPDLIVHYSAMIGAGFMFRISPKSNFGLDAGYSYLPTPRRLDGRNDYSGLLIKLTFSRAR